MAGINEYPHLTVSTGARMFTLRAGYLEFLLIRRAALPSAAIWALPGGFVDLDETLGAVVAWELEEETGITGGGLEQLDTFGASERDTCAPLVSRGSGGR